MRPGGYPLRKRRRQRGVGSVSICRTKSARLPLAQRTAYTTAVRRVEWSTSTQYVGLFGGFPAVGMAFFRSRTVLNHQRGFTY